VADRAGRGAARLHFPNDQQRITVIGKTGSGKTQGGAWLLSERNYDRMPWLVFNWKHDELLDSIPGSKQMSLDDRVPKHPGVYVLHPNPADTADVEELMMRVWAHERVGLFIDEGYMIPRMSPAFQAILTQGRSKRLPVIMLTQRPAWVSRFAFSEADYIQLYQLTDRRDAKVVKEFMPLPIEQSLPGPYWSWYWDNTRNFKAVLQPVPSRDNILETFYRRLRQPRRAI
jgi:hypothetical protein